MGVSKFVVYKLLLLELHLQLSVCHPATGSEHLENCSTNWDNQANHDKCHTTQQSTAEIFDKVKPKTLVTDAQPKPTQNDQTNSSTEEEDENEFHFLITGGYRPVVNNIVKFVVSVRSSQPRKFFGDNHFCGGSIISKQAVLSAAHCFLNKRNKVMRPSQLRIFAGTSRRLFRSDDTQELLVKKLITHPKFSHSSLTNDVAVITLKTKVKIDGITADVIPIPNKEPTIGAKCTVIGWGTVIQFGPTPDEVLNADVYIQPYAICKQDTLFTKGMLCAADINDYEVDSCQGDSGGPLICDGFVTGIVSFGIGCGERGSYGVYSDVYYYRNWINNNRATQQKLNGLPAFALAIAIALRAFRIQYF